MINHRAKPLALILGISLGLLLAACAPAAQPAKPAEKEAAPVKQKPISGGVYRYSATNPRASQDPHKTTASAHFSNYGQAYSSLLRYKFAADVPEGTFTIVPDLAERWENPTPTTWIIYLRKGAKWHNIPPVNGREFTADDVVYSVNRLAGKGSTQNGYWLDLEKVEALDKYTVKFTIRYPSAPFLSILAFGFNKMVAKEAVDAANGDLVNGPLIGTGPWFVNCTVDVECVFKRNPEFFLKDENGIQLPYLDGWRNVIMVDVQARFAAFRAKQLDFYGMTDDERKIAERAHPEIVIKETKGFAASLIHFRGDKAPWNDERVRTAVSKAIDRQEVIDTIYGGRGWFNMGWANPAEDWDIPQEEFKQAYKRDLPLAKKLLTEAGYPNGLDISLWCANYSADIVPMCELLTAQLAEAGIRTKIKVHDTAIYNSQVYTRNGQFEDIAGFAQGTPLEPDLWLSDYYHSQGGRNSSYVNDPKLDQMIDDQRRELDPNKRKKLIQDIQRYLLQKNYSLTVRTPLTNNAFWPWVKNRSFSAGGDYPAQRWAEYIWIDQELKKKMGASD